MDLRLRNLEQLDCGCRSRTAPVLSFVASFSLRAKSPVVSAATWLMTIVGMSDLLSALPTGLLFQVAGDFGACIMTALGFVPLLLVSHVLIIFKLLQPSDFE